MHFMQHVLCILIHSHYVHCGEKLKETRLACEDLINTTCTQDILLQSLSSV